MRVLAHSRGEWSGMHGLHLEPVALLLARAPGRCVRERVVVLVAALDTKKPASV
jgi:hypothetical protein